MLREHVCVCAHTAGAHYYCESMDITRPFPSDRPASDPSWHFVWNKALSYPFRLVGLDGTNSVCPALLQVGVCGWVGGRMCLCGCVAAQGLHATSFVMCVGGCVEPCRRAGRLQKDLPTMQQT